MRMLPLVAVLAPALGLGACHRPPPGLPAEAVVRFYAAVEALDCAAARERLGAPVRARLDQSAAPCNEFLGRLREHPIERIVDTQSDGRNPAARLVRVHLRGHATDTILRVEAEDGQWKIFAL